MDKAAKRIMAKQQKANLKTGTPTADSVIAEQKLETTPYRTSSNQTGPHVIPEKPGQADSDNL